MIDFEAAAKAIAGKIVMTIWADNLSSAELRTISERFATVAVDAALGDSLLYEPVYLDGRDTSNAAPQVNGMDWKGRRWGDWVRVWPKVES